jgi:hypothetical protein
MVSIRRVSISCNSRQIADYGWLVAESLAGGNFAQIGHSCTSLLAKAMWPWFVADAFIWKRVLTVGVRGAPGRVR